MSTTAVTQTVAITGSGGLVGKALSQCLQDDGCKLLKVVRRAPNSFETEIQWNTSSGFPNTSKLEGIDAVVHLAGESIAEGRWTESKKQRIRDSRTQGTTQLATALAGLEKKPKVLVSASAIGFYGDRVDEVLDEESEPGSGFLPDVCKAWEEATKPAADAGIRVVNIRIGVVLSKDGGALSKMLTPFKMCVGGKVGSGHQYWSWVTLNDLVRVIQFAIENESLSGPVNAVSPNPSTNIEFTKALGKVLGRPTIAPLPAFVAKLVLGQMATDLLLASARVVPRKLNKAGFEFQQPTIEEALSHALA